MMSLGRLLLRWLDPELYKMLEEHEALFQKIKSAKVMVHRHG